MERANDKGPRIDSTTKKNVRSVSMVSPAALNNNSKKSRTSCRKPALMSYHVRSAHMLIISPKSVIPISASRCSYISSSTNQALPSRLRASASKSSFCCWYACKSNVCPSSMACVPCTTGDITALIVPRTTVGKNITHKPMAKGRRSGNTSIGSALASAFHTR